MNNNNVDKLFKKVLDHQEHQAPVHSWDNIEKHFSAGKKKRSLIFWWSSGIAAACVLLISFTDLWKIRHEQFGAPYSYNIALLEDKETALNVPVKIYVPVAANTDFVVVNDTQEDIEYRKWLYPIELQTRSKFVRLSPPLLSLNLKTPPIRKGFIPLTNAENLAIHEAYNKLLTTEISGLSPEKEKEKINLSLSGHIAPVYASGNYKTIAHNARGYDYGKDQIKGTFNVGGGFKVSLAATSRLSLQTGINYCRMGQATEENGIYAPRATYGKVKAKVGNFVYTPLGRIKNKANATIYRTEGMAALTNTPMNQGTIEQVFGTLEIPLGVKYRLNDNKLRFSVLGGISSSFMVNNNAYLKYNGQKEDMGSTEDIRNFNVATNIGFGIEYPISRNIKVMLEPDFKYYLRSISSNEEVDFRPYTFTLSTGIGINF